MKMNKKGFTLVELLAVIAILAILVIIALPNVLELYRNARKNAFLDEVQSVYTAAVNKYMLSQYGTSGAGAGTYYDVGGEGDNKLDIQNGSGTFKYCVQINAVGEIEKLVASNGTNHYDNGSTVLKQAGDVKIAQVGPTGTGSDTTAKTATYTAGQNDAPGTCSLS